jgi:hypothetical protein
MRTSSRICENAHREELAAGAGDHDRLRVLVVAQTVDDVAQRGQHLAREPVLVARSIERDRQNTAVAIDPQPFRFLSRHEPGLSPEYR